VNAVFSHNDSALDRALRPWHDREKVLVIMHQEGSSPGRVGMMLEAMGYRLVACRPPLGDTLPTTLSDYAGTVVFGGPMSANDPDDYVKREIDWMGVPLGENKPLLGICLGAQMLSKHLGGSVAGRNDQRAEIGYYPIEATPQGNEMMEWPSHVYQWHREGLTLPSGATLLAKNQYYPNQAYSYGEKAFGIQFHPEVTTWMMNRWTTKAAHRFSLPGAQHRIQHFQGRSRHDRQVRLWLERFLMRWIGATRSNG